MPAIDLSADAWIDALSINHPNDANGGGTYRLVCREALAYALGASRAVR